jgi:hypothetical protein
LPIIETTYDVDAALFFNAVKASGAAVVNLSMGRPIDIPEIGLILNRDSKSLFVVATGNNKYDLAKTTVYPARHGGSGHLGQYNLLSVAALDRGGKLAPFSNYGKAYVDIGAEGCGVETFSYDIEGKRYQRVRATGTSFAAPQVARLAALIRATVDDLAPVTPSAIRMRILAGSDFREDLAEAIEDGRVLNPVRTLSSIFFDVVEIARERGVLRRGWLIGPRGAAAFCENPPPALPSAKLLKVGRQGTQADLTVYWTDEDQLLHEGHCRPKRTSLTLREEGTLAPIEVPLADLADIVLAMFPTSAPRP